ncbi:hypothetical protein MASR1M46_18840 [Bacteroidales bacterium]
MGHMTDVALLDVLGRERTKIEFRPDIFYRMIPNGLKFEAFDPLGKKMGEWITFSIGGGDLSDTGTREVKDMIYPHSKMSEILEWCQANGMTFWEYVQMYEGGDIWDFLADAWEVMQDAVERGLETEGVLPGGLKLQRKAASFYIKAKGYQGSMQRRSMTLHLLLLSLKRTPREGWLSRLPICGSSGVIPALLYLNKQFYDFSDKRIMRVGLQPDDRQHNKDKCINLRCRGWMPGRGWICLCYGGSGRCAAIWRDSGSDRVRRFNRNRAFSRPHL